MPNLYDNYSGTAEPYISLTLNAANDWGGQSFTTTAGYTLSRIDIWCAKGVGDNVGTITVALYAVDDDGHPTGSALASGSIDDANIPTTGEGYDWVACTLSSSYAVSAATKYCVVVHGTSLSASNILIWSYDDDAGSSAFSGGDQEWSTDGGSSWSTDTTQDQLFRCYGSAAVPTDKTYSRSLIAAGNYEVWYESSAGTMAELSAANGDIDTSEPLTIVEAYQKAFIANTTNLKVADFVNTKLTHSALTTAHARGDILTQATSAATMVVDFTNTAKTATYGYVTSGTFNTTDEVSGSGTGTAFTPTAVTSQPHWYDWTVYPGGASGSMPASAYLVCRYRGRLVLSGNPNYPHQWYMSKVGDPWDWLYSATDPLTAVAGNNTDAGEIGDIVRCLIPYGDDFLVFGCANSVHILDGDPASGGSIDELSDTTGIYSWTSWCRDDDGNLYFYGRNGIYLMQGGRSRPTNISKAHLPQLASDWAINPSTHRVVMAYDNDRRGILIFKTTIADGTCTGYFYSLETEGFYPITLQTQCGVFNSFDYNSDTPADRSLLLGSDDGYIRGFLDSAKDDDTGDSDTAISSYFGIVEKITEDDDKVGLLSSLTVVMAGGASGGDFSDSDGCSYEYHKADDAETVLEDLKDGAPAFTTGTLSGTGRKSRIRKRMRAAWLALKFYNSTAAETFGINRIFGIISQKGRIK